MLKGRLRLRDLVKLHVPLIRKKEANASFFCVQSIVSTGRKMRPVGCEEGYFFLSNP